ncbi:MAG: DUF6273 domain-containing protein [Propionibacteriaceae bacterium]|jgi:hypothetical protein|nr:DUF6273 domain-containing protein [Propionibacteriaceae bacterium]
MTDDERFLREAEATVNVGGEPEWLALSVDQTNRRALFITRDIVAQKPYHEPGGDVTWEGCSLRKWLNGAFFASLPAQVKSRVNEVTIPNPDNKEYETKSGNSTKDRVFLLSLDEVAQHLKDNNTRVARFNGSAGWWWLRSPGYRQSRAALVHGDGGVDDSGYAVYDDGGLGNGVGGCVRPALWLDLKA